RARIECKFAAAMRDLGELQQRRIAASPSARTFEPEDGPRLNRHQRRALQAMERQRRSIAA
ncbi:MAG: hypothetical protein WAS21_06380, partial [Geminicoccaceae bacterium]